MTTENASKKSAQLRVVRRSPAYWRVTIDNPPINVMSPEMVRQFQEVIDAIEADEHVRVVVFDAAQNGIKALMARGFHKPGMPKIDSDTT